MILLSLLATFIPYEKITFPLAGTFIGTTQYACFPILQYLPFFIAGMYCQKKRAFFDWRIWGLAFFSTTSVFLWVFLNHSLPSRFPPSLGWILWPSLLTLLYYLFACKLGNWLENTKIKVVAYVFGAYTLDYLVISNILVFVVRYHFGKSLNFTSCVVFSIFILALCFSYGYIKKNKLWRL